MPRPAIQLYSLRGFDEPLPDVLERVAAAGYEGVEFAHRVQETDPGLVADALDDTGLTPVSAHLSLGKLERSLEDLVRRYDRLGCHDIVVPHLSAAHYRTRDRVDAAAGRLLDVERRLDEYGFRLHYHNQVHDCLPLRDDAALGPLLTAVHPDGENAGFDTVSGRVRSIGGLLGDTVYERLYQRPVDVTGLEDTGYHRLAEATGPALGLQVDAGAVAAAGLDPTAVVDRYADRIRSVHLKDVAVDDPHPTAELEPVSAGEGILDVDAVLAAAAEANVDWMIYENDDPRSPEEPLSRGIDVMGREHASLL